MNNRVEDLREKMQSEGVDFIALGPGAHMNWLLDVKPHADERHLLACITADKVGFLMPALEAESARKQTDLPFYSWADEDGPVDAFRQLLVDFDAVDSAHYVLDESMRADFAGIVQDALPGAKRSFAESTIGALRMRKDDAEYAILKRNALIADAAMQAGWEAMKLGMTELDVAGTIRANFADQNASPLFTIIGTDGNGAFPHHHTGNSVLKTGDAVVMDIGGGQDGYSSDITRMAIIGEKPEGYDEIHAIVEAAVEAAMKAARPGVKAHEVDDAARGVISDAGYGDYFVHRTGHGMGVEIHEPPYITSSSQSVLEAGMVFSIEPGIYLPGRFGIRLEDIVILRPDGPEIFSTLSREARVIDG